MSELRDRLVQKLLNEAGFRFTTETSMPSNWDSVTAQGTDSTPWWIHKEELRKRDNKITFLETRLAQQQRTMEQMETQQKCDGARANLKVESLQRQVQIKRDRIEQLEVEVRQQNFNNELLRGLHHRLEQFENAMIPVHASGGTKYKVVEWIEDSDSTERLDPSAKTGEADM